MENKNKIELDFTTHDYHVDKTYEARDFKDVSMKSRTFEECTFRSCYFNEMSLAGVVLDTCTFENCEFINDS